MVCQSFGGEDAGGFVMWASPWHVVGVLVVSQEFGDKILKQYVVVVPKIQEEMINDGIEFFSSWIMTDFGMLFVVRNLLL